VTTHDPTPLSIWVIYDHPSDYPDDFVARRWEGETATRDIILGKSLGMLRLAMRRKYLTCLPRYKDDDPVIVETWL
jgi:hypothetical protein